MKCEDFKKYMADLCDKQTDPAITEACRQHMKECAACRAYYEDFMHTVNLLTPKHAPSFGKTQPAVSISPLQTTAKPKKHPSHKWIQIAAAVAIFMAARDSATSSQPRQRLFLPSPSFSTSLSRVHAVRPASPCRFTPVLRLTKISPTSIRNPAS